MRGRVRRAIVPALLVILAVAVWGPAASADTSTVTSEPNGDLTLTVSAGCATDKNKDGDPNTCIQADTVTLTFGVFNQTSDTQTVQIDYELDGPGTDLDRAFTKEVVIGPDPDAHIEREEVKIKNPKKTLPGTYTLTVTASGSETATTSASFTVEPKN